MDINSEESSLLDHSPNRRKGGLKTLPFIIVNESFERLASHGIMPNMIIYLMKGYHLEAATASSILFIWFALSNGLAIFGAFLSDSYLGRFLVIVLGSISSLLGMILLWMTAILPQLKPSPCDKFNHNCNAPKAAQISFLLSSLLLISIGSGCIRPCSIAFGADQLNKKKNPNNERVIESYFNWYYASIGISTVLALTLLVYIQDHFGWMVGFGIPAILMVFSALMFLIGSSHYIKVKVSESLFTGFLQVLVAAFRSRDIDCPLNKDYKHYHTIPDSKFLMPNEDFRCLNKACIIRDPNVDLTSDGSASNPWNLCSVEQVESFKILLRIFPMWSTGLILLLTMNQGSFTTLQAKSMNRHIFSSFEIPPGSFNVFLVITLTIWIAIYDRLLAPLLARYTGDPQGLSPVIRMGIGLIMSCMAMATAAITENIRRKSAVQEGIQADQEAVVNMSAMWLVPQAAFIGLAEALNAIGQIQFFYMQFPKSMSSVAVAVYSFGMAVSSLIGSVLVNAVNGFTTHGGNSSWLASNINEGHLDYYYCLLCFLNVINFLYFLLCYRNLQPNEEASGRKPQYRHLPSA